MYRSLLIALLFSACTWAIQAQIKSPQPSPLSKLEQKVGLTDITIEYSRPGVKDRSIFGGLVPFGEMWRTGANASTKITFSDNVSFGGVAVDAGQYALYTIPSAGEWTVMLYTDVSHWGTPGDAYSEDKIAAKVMASPMRLAQPVETFTIDLANIRDGQADLHIKWAETAISVPLTLATEEAVMASIDKVMAGPSWRDYYQAGRYYVENDKDPAQALRWMEKAVEGEGGEKFWVWRWVAHAQAANKNYAEAVKSSMKSKELATAADYAQYVRFANEDIAQWKSMMK